MDKITSYKIAIVGKANSGKNTLARLLKKESENSKKYFYPNKYIAFADPIKEIARTMFPNLPEKYLTGPSKYRTEIISGAFKEGKPLTVRQLILDIGTNGRLYNEKIWVEKFDYSFNKFRLGYSIIVTDCRFINEFDHLSKLNFTTIKLLRDCENTSLSEHQSESEQDLIPDNRFNFIIDNNGTLDNLKLEVRKIISHL